MISLQLESLIGFTLELRRQNEKKKQKEYEKEILNSGHNLLSEKQPSKNSTSPMKIKHKNGVMIKVSVI